MIMAIDMKKIILKLKQLLAKNITNNENRFLRVAILQQQISDFVLLLKKFDYPADFIINKEGAKIFNEGVVLDLNNKFLKLTTRGANEGLPIDVFLRQHRKDLKTIIDAGAFQGEISLYFASKYPDAKIYAIEASPENFKLLKKNIGQQFFSTKNIFPFNTALSSVNGTTMVSIGGGSENTIVDVKDGIKTPCITLDKFIQDNQIDKIDLLKIDIEGAEPMLFESIKKHLEKIQVIYMEITCSRLEDYKKMLGFLSGKRRCFSMAYEQINDVIKHIEDSERATNVFFIN